jgi:hypothetical protein
MRRDLVPTKLAAKIFVLCGALKVPSRAMGEGLFRPAAPGFNGFGWMPSRPDSKLHFASIKAMFWI